MSDEAARKHLRIARKQLERASTFAFAATEEDYENVVTWCFYAVENAVVAAAEKVGLTWEKNHRSKADVAERLHKDGRLNDDVSDRILELNELRKDVQYGEPGPELLALDLEGLVAELDALVDEVAALIGDDASDLTDRDDDDEDD